MGMRRFRALVSWLPPEAALVRAMAMETEAQQRRTERLKDIGNAEANLRVLGGKRHMRVVT